MRTRPVLVVLGMVVVVAGAASVWSQQADRQEATIVQPQAQVGAALQIVVSPDNDMVWGYSKHTGAWHPLELVRRTRQPPKVLCGEWVAIVQAAGYVYGFSAVKGVWDTLQVGQSAMAAPVVMADWATISTPGRIHAFSGQTGKWASLDVQAEIQRRPPERR